MSYLHEQQMQKAVKRLYMLGGKRSSDKTDYGAGDALGAAINFGRKKEMTEGEKSEGMKRAIMDQSIRSQTMQRDQGLKDDRAYKFNMLSGAVKSTQQAGMNQAAEEQARASQFMTGTGAEKGMAQHAVDFNRANGFAEATRMGGKFTPLGLEKSISEADANAADRARARSFMGIGGTRVPMMPSATGTRY